MPSHLPIYQEGYLWVTLRTQSRLHFSLRSDRFHSLGSRTKAFMFTVNLPMTEAIWLQVSTFIHRVYHHSARNDTLSHTSAAEHRPRWCFLICGSTWRVTLVTAPGALLGHGNSATLLWILRTTQTLTLAQC